MSTTMDNPERDYFNDDLYLDEIGAREIWIQILCRSCLDASNNSLLGDHEYHRSTARTFLTAKSDHFYDVCENAGIQAETVIKWAERQKKNGWPALGQAELRQLFKLKRDTDDARRKDGSIAEENNHRGRWGGIVNDNFSLKPVYERFA